MNSNDLSARVIEVYFFFQKRINGKFETSAYYNTLEEAIQDREATLKNSDFEDISPIIKGYI